MLLFQRWCQKYSVKSEVEVDCGALADRAGIPGRWLGEPRVGSLIRPVRACSLLSTKHACNSCSPGPEVDVLSQDGVSWGLGKDLTEVVSARALAGNRWKS